MKIAVVGSGAIGLFYGALLQRSGQAVHFLMRSDFAAAKQAGIRVVTADESFALDPVNVHETTESIGSCDLVIVSLKSTSNEALAELLPLLVSAETSLLTLQNGLGNDRLLAELFPANPIFGGLCFVCLNRIAPAVVENYLPGAVSIGPYRKEWVARAQELTDLFRAAGVETRFEENLQLVQWKKLVWNVPFNGLAVAAGGVATDVIVGSPELRSEARGLMEEVLAIASALGFDIDKSFIDFQIERTIPMKAYKPSSMIDFVEGRRVEVEAIWGEPMRQAREAGVPAPKLEMLYALLKQLCK